MLVMDELLHESPSLRLHVCADARLISSSHDARLRTELTDLHVCVLRLCERGRTRFPGAGRRCLRRSIESRFMGEDSRTPEASVGAIPSPSSDLCSVSGVVLFLLEEFQLEGARYSATYDDLRDPT